MRPLAAALVAASLLLSACGSDETKSPVATSPAAGEPTAKQPSETPEAAETPAHEAKSATEIAEAIQAEIAEIEDVVTITEDNDPNDKIGRPNGYIDGAVMVDSRADPTSDEPGAESGAFLEVWPDADSAKERSEYIQKLQKDAPILGSEYHYRHEGYLLRVTGAIKPSAAKAYEKTFDAQF